MRAGASRLSFEADVERYALWRAGCSGCRFSWCAPVAVIDTPPHRSTNVPADGSGGNHDAPVNAGRLLICRDRLGGEADCRVRVHERDDGAAEPAAGHPRPVGTPAVAG